MKVLNLGSNKKKKSGKDLIKIEGRFAEGKQRVNSLEVVLQTVTMVNGKLIIWSKHRWNIGKCILRKFMRKLIEKVHEFNALNEDIEEFTSRLSQT